MKLLELIARRVSQFLTLIAVLGVLTAFAWSAGGKVKYRIVLTNETVEEQKVQARENAAVSMADMLAKYAR